MKTFKKIHLINKIFLTINIILYFTIYLGMLFQIILGITQLILAIDLIINKADLNEKSKKRLSNYWVLVLISIILIVFNNFYGNDFGNFLFLFLLPMIIALYFYFITANINNLSFLTAQWNDIILINYVIDPKKIEKYVPKGTELDLWEGKCYISLIGFMFEDVKVLGIKVPNHVNFEEVNLRFYVKRFENEQWKRGVVFVKEIVPKKAISFVANTLYNEHYATLPMKHTSTEDTNSKFFKYEWKKEEQWNSISMKTDKTLLPIEENSEAEFITEHYFGYTKFNENKTIEYEVTHPRWNQLEVLDSEINVDFKNIYGSDFSFLQDLTPKSTFFAKGSAITIEGKKIIK